MLGIEHMGGELWNLFLVLYSVYLVRIMQNVLHLYRLVSW